MERTGGGDIQVPTSSGRQFKQYGEDISGEE
jgi:hypothetical protein